MATTINSARTSMIPALKNEMRENGTPPPQIQFYRLGSVNILPLTGPIFVKTGDIEKSKNDFRPPMWTKEVPFFTTSGAVQNQSNPALRKSVETDRN